VKKARQIFSGLILIMALSGCATFSALSSDQPLNNRLFIYSGVRLDWFALTNNEAELRKIKVSPPDLPLVDLPFSFALDTLLLPKSIVAEIFH
jgi:uncharacterized protein YceK